MEHLLNLGWRQLILVSKFTSALSYSVVDAPIFQIRNTETSDTIQSENVKFVGDNSTIYFELSSQGQTPK